MSEKPAHIEEHQLVRQSWQGPIPPPSTLRAFKELVPDAPERILLMAEEEARVRREMMQKDSESENRRKEADLVSHHRNVRRGQWVAFVYLMCVLGGAVFCARIGCEKVGIAIATMATAGIVANFVWRK